MRKIGIGIIEDNPNHIATIKKGITSFNSISQNYFAEILFITDNTKHEDEAGDMIEYYYNRINFIFLDIELSGSKKDGLQIAKENKDLDYIIVSKRDILLSEIQELKKFVPNLTKVEGVISKTDIIKCIENYVTDNISKLFLDFIKIKENSDNEIVLCKDVFYISTLPLILYNNTLKRDLGRKSNQIYITTTDNCRCFNVRSSELTIENFIEKKYLNPGKFYRINASEIINTDYIQNITGDSVSLYIPNLNAEGRFSISRTIKESNPNLIIDLNRAIRK